jgi:hypothetical protein
MLSRGLECFRQGWNALYRDGMLSTLLECFLQSWNALDSVGDRSPELERLWTC